MIQSFDKAVIRALLVMFMEIHRADHVCEASDCTYIMKNR